MSRFGPHASRRDLAGWAAVLGRFVLRVWGFRSRSLPGGMHVMERPARPGKSGTRDLLFIHGIGVDVTNWLSMMPYLGRRHTLRLLDLPSHGASEDAEEVDIESLSTLIVAAVDTLPPSVVIGNSLGGAIALLLATRLPAKVEGLFLLSPAGPPMDREAFEATVGQFDIKTWREARGFLGKLFATFPYNTGAIAPLVLAVWSRPTLHKLRLAFNHEGLISVEQARAMTIPVFLSWGERDGVLPSAIRDWLVEHVPGLQRADPADEATEAHSPQIERPRSVARRILRFVRSTTRPGAPP